MLKEGLNIIMSIIIMKKNTNLLNSVGCRGTELSLFDCSSDPGYCDEYNIAAVDCA